MSRLNWLVFKLSSAVGRWRYAGTKKGYSQFERKRTKATSEQVCKLFWLPKMHPYEVCYGLMAFDEFIANDKQLHAHTTNKSTHSKQRTLVLSRK